MCCNLSSTPPLTLWIPYPFVYKGFPNDNIHFSPAPSFSVSMWPFPCKHVVLFLIETEISLDLQLPPVPQFSTSLYCKSCAKMISTYSLYLISSSLSLESQFGFSSPTTAPKLVLWRPPQHCQIQQAILIPHLTRLISSNWRNWPLYLFSFLKCSVSIQWSFSYCPLGHSHSPL